MARDNKGAWIIGIILLVLAGMYFVPAFDVFNIFAVVTEEGYLLFGGTSDTGVSGTPEPINGQGVNVCNTDYGSYLISSAYASYCSTTYWDFSQWMVGNPVECNGPALLGPAVFNQNPSIYLSNDNHIKAGSGICVFGDNNAGRALRMLDTRFKQNLKNFNFKIDTKFNYGSCSWSSARYMIKNSIINPTKSVDIGYIQAATSCDSYHGSLPSPVESKGIELKPSILNNSKLQLYFGGYLTGEIDVSDWEGVYFYVEGNDIDLINPRFKPIFSCQLGPNDLIVAESFGPNHQIDLFSTRYPVKQFCLDLPTVLTDDSEGGAVSTVEPYNLFSSGGSYTTTDDQTLTVFYVMDNTAGLITTVCDVATEYYNLDTSSCKPRGGIVFVCPEGPGALWDFDNGICLTTTDVACTQGGTWNTTSKRCEYDSVDGCALPYVFDLATQKCVGSGANVIVCTPPYTGVIDNGIPSCRYVPVVDQICVANTIQPDGTCQLLTPGDCPLNYEKVVTGIDTYYCTFSMQQSCESFGGTWTNNKCNIFVTIINTTTCTLDSQCPTTYICTNGRCLYIESGCLSNSDCNSDYPICFNKKCVYNEPVINGTTNTTCLYNITSCPAWSNCSNSTTNCTIINCNSLQKSCDINNIVCGNNVCDAGESVTTCPNDCKEIEPNWFEENWMWVLIAGLIILFLLINNGVILKSKRSFLSIWLFKYRYGIFVGLIGAALLSYYYWNFGLWLLDYFKFLQPIDNTGMFVAYLISIVTGGILGGIVYDILKKWRILK